MRAVHAFGGAHILLIGQRPQHGCTTVADRAHRLICAGVLPLRTGDGATRRSTHTYTRACLVHAPCTHLGPVHRRHAESANDWILRDCDGRDSVSGCFGTPSARAVREKQCGSACVDHRVAIAHSSIAALWSTVRSMSMLAYSASL